MSYSEFIYRSFWGLPIDLTKELRHDTQSIKEVSHEKESKKKKD